MVSVDSVKSYPRVRLEGAGDPAERESGHAIMLITFQVDGTGSTIRIILEG